MVCVCVSVLPGPIFFLLLYLSANWQLWRSSVWVWVCGCGALDWLETPLERRRIKIFFLPHTQKRSAS